MPYVETGIIFLNIDLQTFKEQNKMSAHGPWLVCGHMLETSQSYDVIRLHNAITSNIKFSVKVFN